MVGYITNNKEEEGYTMHDFVKMEVKKQIAMMMLKPCL
jgi:hypothetical protein